MPQRESTAPTRSALTVVYRRPADLKPFENNARTHSQEQVAQIAASILEFGFNDPIGLRDDDATIGEGHGRRDACLLILSRGERLPTPDGETVPTITLRGLTDAQWRAYTIAHNKIALNAGWDEELLAAELSEILADAPDLQDVLGFEQIELDGLLGRETDAGASQDPDFNYREQFGVIVLCADEAAQREAFEALSAEGYDCKVVVT